MEDIKKFADYIEQPEDFDPKEWEVENIISIMDEDPQTSEENLLKNEAITFDASVPRDVSRGDFIWITALIKRKGATSLNDPGRQAVIKLRVVDIYYGLQHLNKVINQK